MQKRLSLLFVALFAVLITTSFAAIKKVNGYYITLTDDTVRCTFLVPYDSKFEFPKYLNLQKRIDVMDAAGKKTKLIPFTTRKCVMQMDTMQMIFVGMKNPMSKSKGKSGSIFLKQIVKNYLSVYEYYGEVSVNATYYNNSPYGSPGYYGGYSTVKVPVGESLSFFLQKENGELKLIPYITLKQDLVTYFADYPALAKKIQSDEYRKKDILKIAAEYNKFILDKEDN